MRHTLLHILVLSGMIFSSCGDNDTLDKDDITKIEIIKCYPLEDVFPGFIQINAKMKTDTSSDINPTLLDEISNPNAEFKDYPLFRTFKPNGYFDGVYMTFINSAFLGFISNDNIDYLNNYLENEAIIDNFPTHIYFQYIPSPFVENMSVLIGVNDNVSIIGLTKSDISRFGFEKIESFDLSGNLVKESDEDRIYSPYLVFDIDILSILKNDVYLIKLKFQDAIIYKSIDKEDINNNTIYFDYLFDKMSIVK